MANYTILLIDYEPRSVERTRAPLTAAGYRVHVASDGLAGIARFEELEPALVLVEAMIPKKHGFEVCQELKRTPQGKRTPIIIMTSVYKGRKYRSQALHIHQCDEYIEKPITSEQLVGIVRRFIGEPEGVPAPQPEPETVAAAVPVKGSGLLDSIPDEEIAEIEIVDYDAPETYDAPESGEPERPERPETRRATPAPEPRRSAFETTRGALAVSDPDEAEIMERLDAIMSPAPPQPAPRNDASIATEPDSQPTSPPQGEIVNFSDAKRARKRKQRQGKSSAAAVATPPRPEHGAAMETALGAATAVSVQTAPADRTEQPQHRPEAWQNTEPARPPVPAWVWGAAVVAIAVVGYLLIRGH